MLFRSVSQSRYISGRICFRGTGRTTLTSTTNPWEIICSGRVKVSGDIRTVLDHTTMPASVGIGAFRNMFSQNFSSQCIEYADELIIPFETLPDDACNSMFKYAGKLKTAPSLPATNVGVTCYFNMFSYTALTFAPNLPATSIGDQCYGEMFAYSTSLKVAPVMLPATTLAMGCYWNMFSLCSNLTNTPVLPATTLADACYELMFAYCTSLITAPALPATTISNGCYNSMFMGCSNLKSFNSHLPATILSDFCYTSMFEGCINLETSIEIYGLNLTNRCFKRMFGDCNKLAQIKVNFRDWAPTSIVEPTTDWVSGVSETGQFTKPTELVALYGPSNIPTGWNVL